jgi:hypothetical protein
MSLNTKRIDTIPAAKWQLFLSERPNEVEQRVQEYRDLIRDTTFIGASIRKDRAGNEVDWRLPFSEELARACIADPALREKLKEGTLSLAELKASESLTDFGADMQRVLEGSTLIDLGCGGPQSQIPKELARIFGSPYVGVDKYEDFQERVEQGPTSRAYIKGEILETLTRLGRTKEGGKNLTLLLSGIELSYKRSLVPGQSPGERSDAYANACREEINRLRPRAIIIGAGTSPGLRPDPSVFMQLTSVDMWTTIGVGGSSTQEIWVPKN